MSTLFVPVHQREQDQQVVSCTLHCKIAVHASFQRPIELFHHQGFSIALRGKMPNTLLGQPAHKSGIVKFFAFCVCKRRGRRPLQRRKMDWKAAFTALPVFLLKGATHAHLDKTLMSVIKYRIPRFYRFKGCISSRSATIVRPGKRR